MGEKGKGELWFFEPWRVSLAVPPNSGIRRGLIVVLPGGLAGLNGSSKSSHLSKDQPLVHPQGCSPVRLIRCPGLESKNQPVISRDESPQLDFIAQLAQLASFGSCCSMPRRPCPHEPLSAEELQQKHQQSEKIHRAVRMIQYFAGGLTTCLICAVCSNAVVVYIRHCNQRKTRIFTLRQMTWQKKSRKNIRMYPRITV